MLYVSWSYSKCNGFLKLNNNSSCYFNFKNVFVNKVIPRESCLHLADNKSLHFCACECVTTEENVLDEGEKQPTTE